MAYLFSNSFAKSYVMKKIYFSAFLLLASIINLHATTFVVNVEDFEFDPKTFSVNTGDTILWSLDNSSGAHTTTSTNIPTGAAAWNQVLTQGAPNFSYVPTVPGTYSYICLYHVSMGMSGTFTVSGASGIQSNAGSSFSLLNILVENDKIKVSYQLPNFSSVDFRLFNVIGEELQHMTFARREGIYTDALPADIPDNGIYMLQVSSGNVSISKRFLVAR
jgi:plastocyanin